MSNYRIYGIIIVAVMALSAVLPKVYESIFAKRSNHVFVSYSPVTKGFVTATFLKGKERKTHYSDINESKIYTKEEYMQLLPFRYFSSLLKIDKFPKGFEAFAREGRIVKKETKFIRISPTKVTKKDVPLYPLFESKEKYGGLKNPKDIFRISKNGIEFIITATNKIDSNKTVVFNQALLAKKAVLPLKDVFGNPTSRKPFDEGYFIVDAKGDLIHLKMVEGEPYVKKILTKDFEVKFMNVKEHISKEFYAVIVASNSSVYLLSYDDYDLIKLPIDMYDYKTSVFKLFATPLHRVLQIEHDDEENQIKTIDTVTTNLDYDKIAQNRYVYSVANDYWYETIHKYLFPFITKIERGKEYYRSFEWLGFSPKAYLFYGCMALLYLLVIRVQKGIYREGIFPTLFIFAGGIYSIIALIVFGKFWNFKHKKGNN